MSKTFRLLLIDDSEEDEELLLREIRRAGLECSHQRVDSLAGLESALSDSWDIVISDYSMPQLDGQAAFELVKGRGADQPFIFVSGILSHERAIEAMRAGAKDYVRKDRLDRIGPVLTRELAEAENRKARQRLEESLRAEGRRYQNIFDSAEVALVEFDLSGTKAVLNAATQTKTLAQLFDDPALALSAAERARILAVNPAAARMMEAESPEQLLGPLTQVLRSGSMPGWLDTLRALAVNEGLNQREIPLETMQGRGLTVLLAFGAPTTEDDLKHVVVSLTDITERKQMERQMRAAQRMEAVGQLAAGIAHDFNNVLTVIRSYANFLLEALHADGVLRQDVLVIQDAAARAEGLTKQLLAFSRRQISEPQILSVNRLVGEMDKMLQRLIGADIGLVTTLQEDLGLVEIDPTHVEQILTNLAVNARDAMPEGGRLTIETQNVTLDADYGAGKPADVPTGEYVMVALSDSGTGIDEETRLRLFEPFFTTKAPGKGTGLGLSTCYGIVKQAGGFIWVYSELGSGTTFKVYLPRKEATGESFVPGGARVRHSLEGTETILLVEDEEHVRRAAERILAKAGYRVLVAASGVEALLLSEQYDGRIDAMISDIVMPTMNGKQLAERLHATRPGLKVLFMSGYTDNAIVHNGVLDQGVMFLQKPFTPEVLLTKLREVLYAP